MKGVAIVVIGFVVLVALLLSGTLNPLMADLYRKLTGTPDPNEPAPDTSDPSDPTVTPQPVRNKSILIYYSLETAESLPSNYYAPVEANSGYIFLKVTMDIENRGYDTGFSTNATLFSVTANQTTYSVDVLGSITAGQWRGADVENGQNFYGTLVFQVSESASSFTLGYFQPDLSNRFKIVWIET